MSVEDEIQERANRLHAALVEAFNSIDWGEQLPLVPVEDEAGNDQ